MKKSAPLSLVGLLGGGLILLWLHALFPVPFETWLAFSGIILIATGLLSGLVMTFGSMAVLWNLKSRKKFGVVIPVLTIVLIGGAWSIFLFIAFLYITLMDNRAEYSRLNLEEEMNQSGEGVSQHTIPDHTSAPRATASSRKTPKPKYKSQPDASP